MAIVGENGLLYRLVVSGPKGRHSIAQGAALGREAFTASEP
jgi:hypothetical protein